MRIVVVGLIATATVLVASCGAEPPPSPIATQSSGVDDPYSGPMYVEPDYSDDATVLARSGAAGRALECSLAPYAGGGGDYTDGLERAQDSPARALQNWFDEELFWQPLPRSGYRVEREDDERVLLSYDVDGRTVAAFTIAKGIRDWDDSTGWGVESWAVCDPAELPADIAEAANLGVWTDSSGDRVSVAEIRSYRGPEHCDWQDITFLELGPEDSAAENTYLRDVEGELAASTRTSFASGIQLPNDATDTGFRHGGQELWLVPNDQAAYLVRTDDPDDIERWPAAKRGISCE